MRRGGGWQACSGCGAPWEGGGGRNSIGTFTNSTALFWAAAALLNTRVVGVHGVVRGGGGKAVLG